MPNIESIKIKFEEAKKVQELSIEIRNELQTRVDETSDQTIKDILQLAVIQITTNIEEIDVQLLEVSNMIAEYERRINPDQ